MANILSNMLKLQQDWLIPMKLDMSTKDLLEYYTSKKTDFDPLDKSLLLKAVIADLNKKLNPNI